MKLRQPLFAGAWRAPDRIRIDQRLAAEAKATVDERGALSRVARPGIRREWQRLGGPATWKQPDGEGEGEQRPPQAIGDPAKRSEERRVGKECGYRGGR